MSESIRRKGSSRQLLQNLIRVTVQRSQEDAEEVERERRRRSRETERGPGGPLWPDPPQHSDLENNTELDQGLTASCCLVLDEDEGFSDWSHRLENRHEPEGTEACRSSAQSLVTLQPEEEEEQQQEEQEEEQEQEEGCEQERSSWALAGSPPEEVQQPPDRSLQPIGSFQTCSRRQEARTSCSSTVSVPQDAALQNSRLQPAHRTSCSAAETVKLRGGSCRADGQVERGEEEEVQTALQTAWRSAETQRSTRNEEDEEEEELSFTREEEDDPHLRRKDRHKEEEEHKISDQGSSEDRRSEEVSRRSTRSLSSSSSSSSSKGEESVNCYGPMSPTFKKLLVQFYPDEVNSRVSTEGKCMILERTESLRKSTSSVKKTLLPVSKIDKKLERYTHALEVSSKEGRPGGQPLADLLGAAEPVSSKKSLFEAGDARSQSVASVTPAKDADAFKMGVADLINQWVKGGEDGSRCSSPSRPADSSSGRRCRFVVMGHGKYEKVPADDGCSEDADCQSDGRFCEDF